MKLKFISQINRNGSGTRMLSKREADKLNSEEFELRRLSVSEDTWIAVGFNSYVVKKVK